MLAAGALASVAAAQQLVLENPLPADRGEEVVELPLRQALAHLKLSPQKAAWLVANNAATGERIPLQLYSKTPGAQPEELLLLVHLRANGKLPVAFHADPHAAPLRAQVYGRAVPERKDDFAWENEEVAYRVYGPALQASGEISSGIDVWSKRIPNFVVDSFYQRDREGARTRNPALSYHKDNGQGLDSYDVGPTRGCGGTAVLSAGKLWASKNYTAMRILANGPIRFEFELTYAPWEANGTTVIETKRIALDAGSHLNRITSTYFFEGPQTLELAAGLGIHAGAEVAFPADGVAAVWDTPQDPAAGRIATGLVAAPGQNARTASAAGHALLKFTRRSGEPFVYYAGAGWSKADMPTAAAWEEYLRRQAKLLEHPAVVRWAGQ
jgi:hypothetical protein